MTTDWRDFGDIVKAVGARAYATDIPSNVAWSAVERSEKRTSEVPVAIVFSAAMAEAFLADVVDMASLLQQEMSSPTADIQAVADYAESERISNLRVRYQLVRLLVSQTAWDKGAQTWQDFDALVVLRNEFAHHKPQRYGLRGEETGRIAKALRHLEQRGVLPDVVPQQRKVRVAATNVVCSASVAKWAYAAATAVMLELVAAMPATPLRQMSAMLTNLPRQRARL